MKCHLWSKSNLVSNDFQFEEIRIYEDDSRFQRSLSKCKACGQLYFYEFYEDDKENMYSSYIPISNEKQLEELIKKTPAELLNVKPKIRWDNLGRTVWQRD